MRRLPLRLCAMLLAAAAGAQEPDRQPGVFSETIEVEVSNVEVFVSDRDGNPVLGLEREDFELFLDGEPVPMPYFYAESGGGRSAPDLRRGREAELVELESSAPPSDQRLHVAFVVDNGHLSAVNRKRVFGELRRFLAGLPADALLTVVSLEPELVVHSDFSPDPRVVGQILDSLEQLNARPALGVLERRQVLSELSSTGRVYNREDFSRIGTPYDVNSLLGRIRAYAESEFARTQATLGALSRVVSSLAGVPGRKALLFVSDGIANRPGEELFEAFNYRYGDPRAAPQGFRSAGMSGDYQRDIGRFDLLPQFRQLAQQANAAGVTWYSLDAEGDHATALRSAATAGGVATEALEAFESNVREPAETIATATGGRRLQMRAGLDLSEIGRDFESYYSLGFTPPERSTGSDFRLRVEVRGRGLVVRHRQSWESKSSDERAADALLAALLYHAVVNPLEMSLLPGDPEPLDDGALRQPVEIRIPLRNLVLVPNDGRHAARLSIFVTSRDRRGVPRPVQKIPFGTDIPSEMLAAALEDSVRYVLPILVRSGDRDIAVGARDELGRTGSFLRLDASPRASSQRRP